MAEITSKSSFTRSSFSAALSSRGPSVSLSAANRIIHASEAVKAKVEAHHAKHERMWTNKRLGDLLQRHGVQPTAKPGWAENDKFAEIKDRAQASVSEKLNRRLTQVDNAQKSMLSDGGLRSTRRMSWGRGLGE